MPCRQLLGDGLHLDGQRLEQLRIDVVQIEQYPEPRLYTRDQSPSLGQRSELPVVGDIMGLVDQYKNF